LVLLPSLTFRTATEISHCGADAGGNLSLGIDNIDIGNTGVVAEDNTIRIGDSLLHNRTFIAGIYNVNQGGVPLAVTINANGQLGTQAPSSRRFKKEIKPMDQTSEAILGLKPVTFHYKSDSTGTPQFGLIAEEVAEVNLDLVVRDEKGDIYTVRYDAVNAMLLNEFLKEHRKVEELKKDFRATVTQQQKEIQALTARLEEHAAQIQKVSAQLEVNKTAPQIVLNNQ
jgi:predicted ribosome quality control (RQC) complex YloA/Tae2 family protein